jgi:hypothetical protein
MKKYVLFLIAINAIVAICSCDKEKKDNIVVNNQNNQIEIDTIFPPLSNPIQKLFLEEFNGHTCVNCPLGHIQSATLKARYGDTLVLMSIHAGSFAEPNIAPYTADFTTEAGDSLHFAFGVTGYPTGMINRTPFGGSMVLEKSAWTAAANAIDRSSPELAIQLMTIDNSTDNSINVYAKITFLQAIQKNIKLAIFIIEDSIISPQKNGYTSVGTVPDILDYVHRYTLRETVNSVWGDEIASIVTTTSANSVILKSYIFSFANKPYVKNHCSIIAVACDMDSKEVLQVEEIHLSH